MTGVDSGTFWLSNLVWDIFIYVVALSLTIVVLFSMDTNKTFTTNHAGRKN